MRRLHRTFGLQRPPDSRYRAESCAAVDCAAYTMGWITAVDETTNLGRRQGRYIRGSGKAYTARRMRSGLTEFLFDPGQDCWEQHYIRREVFTADQRVHTTGAFWVEDFAEHQDRLAKEIANG